MRRESLKSYALALSLLLAIPLLGLIYMHLNHEGEATYSLVTDLDRQLSFLKAFVLPYVAWYFFLLAAFMYLAYKNREAYYRTLAQFILGFIICYCVYAVYQTYVPRPELAGDDWMLRMVAWVYRSDEPYNCFPSIHVLSSYLMMKAYLGAASVPRLYTAAVTIMSVLIIASTQFLKQHVLLDIIGAMLVAEGVIYAVHVLSKLRTGKPLASEVKRGIGEGS